MIHQKLSTIFFGHIMMLKMINAINIVFLMDNTYKTNIYRLPLLEIVGVTPTEMTFCAAFVYMEVEREANFVWAL